MPKNKNTVSEQQAKVDSEGQLKIIFISWAPFCNRSDFLMNEFGGTSYMVYYSQFGSNYFSVLFKYFFQAIKTFFMVIKFRPDVIFIMNPPIFTCIPIYIYCLFFPKSGFITDSHSAAFTEKCWRKMYPIQKFFFRRAITNIVTNKSHSGIVESWGADYTRIGDVPVKFIEYTPYSKMKEGFSITVINSFAVDEPTEIILDAARQVPDINFFITGNLKKAHKKEIENKPDNVTFTGFLSDGEYAWLLKNSNVGLTQSNLDNTMQRGVYESMALGVPVITSDWEILRETFYRGTVFVQPTVTSTVDGINEMRKNYDFYKKEIKELKVERRVIWEENKKVVMGKISGYRNPNH